MPKEPKVEIKSIDSVLPDPKNANLHTERGKLSLKNVLKKYGFFRPMAAAGSENPIMMAGNLTLESSIAAGLKKAIFIYTDGTRPIVHVREDIAPDSPQAAALAVADNRVAEISLNWAGAVLQKINAENPDAIADLWSTSEYVDLLNAQGISADVEYSQLPEIDQSQANKAIEVPIKIRVHNANQLDDIRAAISSLIETNQWGCYIAD